MRKSARQNLVELAQWAPIIDEAALRGYVGGGTSDSSYYSYADYVGRGDSDAMSRYI
jgi:hypothetical protein